MLADEAQTWQLLRTHDDPDHLQSPPGYRYDRVNARFNQLAETINAAFCGQCVVDPAQDASFHGVITIPILASSTGRQLHVVISNFKDMAVLAVDNAGEWDDQETAELLHPGDAEVIHCALDELGYTLIRTDPCGSGMTARSHAYVNGRLRAEKLSRIS
ncbi:hypothetical protein [Micromonospora sp. NPDC023737]|uniref:hypothetical protein n=1 Tax=unclassified Micromonospora TaxID=2617518 RepID=UPI0033BFC22B